MSYTDHLTNVETTSFEPTLYKEWFTDPETQALTQALTQSISTHTHSVSTSGTTSEPEPVFKRTRPPPPPPAKKITKRKSRASKRSQTTFIVADPENFREMVQQVTGIRFEPGSVHPNVRPETHRPVLVNRIPAGCLLPTLDTSAFLLDHHHQEVLAPTAVVGGPGFGVETGRVGFDFDGLPSFPTLESWKVM